ncbi:MAG: hypothetical protein WDZ35_14230 [Crocinitomicaceae bacterium]
MKKVRSILVTAMIAVLLMGCSKERTREQKVSTMISEIRSPFFIASMNLQDLMDKSEVMKEGTLPFTYYQVITFFLEQDVTGIDYETEAQVVVGEGKSFLPNFYGIFKIKDEKKFVELIEKEANAEVKEKEGMKYAIKDKEKYCVAWNDEFAVISNIPMDFAAMLSGKGGKEGMKMIDKNIALIKAANDNEINDTYVTFLENKSDVAMLYEGKGFYGYMESMAMGEKEDLEKVKELYEGMSYELYLNFEKGSVNMEMVANLTDELKEKIDFIGKEGVREKLLAYGKSANPMMVGSYKVDVNGALEYFKKLSEDDYQGMEDELNQEGLKIEDIKGAFSGEAVYMINGVEKKEQVYDFGYDEPIIIKTDEPVFAFVLGISDRKIIEAEMNEIVARELMETASTEQMGGYDGGSKVQVLPNGVINMGKAFIYLSDEVLFMSNDSSWANLIAMGKGVKVNNPKGVVNENPFGMFTDLTQLSKIEGLEKEGGEYAKLFKSFYGSANMDGGNFTLELTDASQNSLKVLTVAVGAALADFEKRMNPDMETELEEAVKNTEEELDKMDLPSEEEIEEAVDDAFDKLGK